MRIGAVLLSGIFLTAPAGSLPLARMLPWNWDQLGMSPSAADAIQVLVILFAVIIWGSFLWNWHQAAEPERKRELLRILVFLTAFVILFHAAEPYLTALMLTAALIRAGYDVVLEIRQRISSLSQPDPCG